MRPGRRLAALLSLVSVPSLARGAETRFGGEVGTALRGRLQGCEDPGDCRLLNFRDTSRIGLSVEGRPSERTLARARVELRGTWFTTAETLDDAGDPQRIRPVSLRIEEAYADLYDVLIAGLDLRLGVQRVAWGTADVVSPLDRVNSYDLEDPTRFDRRLGMLALSARLLRGPLQVQAVVVPLFAPALLSVEELDLAAMLEPATLVDLGALSDDGVSPDVRRVGAGIDSPDATLRNMQVGVRVGWESALGDLSVAWWNGRESLPQAHGALRLMGFSSDTGRVDLTVPLRYPRVQVLGADWRRELFWRLTGWVEVAAVLPQECRVRADRAQLEALERLEIIDDVPSPVPEVVTQSDDPYVQAVGGVDATLPGGVYLNLQLLHGLNTERQRADQHDYVLVGARIPMIDAVLALELRAAGELAPGSRLGWLLGGHLAWTHDDSAQVRVGATWLDGADDTSLARFTDLTHASFEAALAF